MTIITHTEARRYAACGFTNRLNAYIDQQEEICRTQLEFVEAALRRRVAFNELRYLDKSDDELFEIIEDLKRRITIAKQIVNRRERRKLD